MSGLHTRTGHNLSFRQQGMASHKGNTGIKVYEDECGGVSHNDPTEILELSDQTLNWVPGYFKGRLSEDRRLTA